MYLNRTGDTLVHDVDHQLVNSAPIQEQLAKLNATYKEILDRLEQEQAKLEMVNMSVDFLQLFLWLKWLSSGYMLLKMI